MRVVLDANIYISALIVESGNPAQILTKWKDGEIEVVVSPAIIEEVQRVTGYERLHGRYNGIRENRDELIANLKEITTIVEPGQTLSVVQQDESDNRYVECAVAADARYIITGDPHLLNIKEYQGIKIVTPAIFLALLETGTI